MDQAVDPSELLKPASHSLLDSLSVPQINTWQQQVARRILQIRETFSQSFLVVIDQYQ
jgi:hypothetical protein